MLMNLIAKAIITTLSPILSINSACGIDISNVPIDYKVHVLNVTREIGCERINSVKLITELKNQQIGDKSKISGLYAKDVIYLKYHHRKVFAFIVAHEYGHAIDDWMRKTNVKKVREFYAISWDKGKMRNESTKDDFMREYAMKNYKEDLADHIAYYYYMGFAFRMKMRQTKSPALRKKYQWIRDNIFHGYEYNIYNVYGTHYTSATKYRINKQRDIINVNMKDNN
jgi:hypothetical protein